MDSAQNAEAVTAPQGRRGGKIDIGVAGGGHFIGGFLLGAAALTAASLALLGINWVRLAGRAGDIGLIFWRMAHFTLDHVDFTLLSFMDTFPSWCSPPCTASSWGSPSGSSPRGTSPDRWSPRW